MMAIEMFGDFRTTLVRLAAVVLSGASLSAQSVDAVAITAPIRVGPSINLHTGQRMSKDAAARARAASFSIYDNSCSWTGAPFASSAGTCATFVDEGVIPGGFGRPNLPPGASFLNDVDSFEIGYCANVASGAVDIKVALWSQLGGLNGASGFCAGVQPVVPQLNLPTAPDAYFQLPIATMPGDVSPGGGGVSCWVVAINLGNSSFCMESDGDGVWDNALDADRFNWSFQFDSPSSPGQAPNSILRAGDPSASVAGGCTYNIPCGTDVNSGAPCGHGLGSADGFWNNIDGDVVADGINTGVACVGAPIGGSTCYWFGGYPSAAFGGFYFVIGSSGSCMSGPCSTVTYCSTGITSAATGSCVATMEAVSGTISASNPAPAILRAANLPNQKTGFIFLGTSPTSTPWGPNGHFLCIAAPTQRTSAQNTNGSAAPAIACDGSISIDINAELAAHGILGQTPGAGMVIFTQGWFRDPASPKTTAMTNGLQSSLCP